MANEITINASMALQKGTTTDRMSASVRVTMDGEHFQHGIQTVGTSDESLDKGDIVTIGYCAFRNKSSDSTITLGAASGQYAIKVGPGEFSGPVRWNGTAVHCVAAPYAAELEYDLYEQ